MIELAPRDRSAASWGFPAKLTFGELVEHYPPDVVHELAGPVVHDEARRLAP